jgi:colanic acid/amylovoran biosynthesis glycosyltransferase
MKERKLRIAFLLGIFPAISETFIIDQITGLIDAGHEVEIFAIGRSKEHKMQHRVLSYGLLERTYYLNVPRSILKRVWKGLWMVKNMLIRGKLEVLKPLNVIRYGRQAATLHLLHMVYPLLDRGPFDILHCHFGPIGLNNLHVKDLGLPGKFIVTFHGHDVSKYISIKGDDVYYSLFQKADLLTPVSMFWRDRLVEMGADPSRIIVHHMGIDLDTFTFQPRSLADSSEIRLLTVGRLVEKKGHIYAIQAVAKLIARHPEWKICYNIVGSGEEDDSLRKLIAELGLHDSVHLLGTKVREDVFTYMMDSHIFVLPSVTDSQGDQEGIPVVLMEAMATGMPVVSTLHTGIPELVQDGVSGYLAPEQDIDGLADRLEELIMHPERWLAMGENGRMCVEKHFNNKVLVQHLVRIYHTLVENSFISPTSQ